MNRCAAGNELPKHGSCPKCGASSSEPCPEALRIAREEREILIMALQFIVEGYDNQDVNHVDFRVKAYEVALDALAHVGSPKQP